jgi:hypothetical protein
VIELPKSEWRELLRDSRGPLEPGAARALVPAARAAYQSRPMRLAERIYGDCADYEGVQNKAVTPFFIANGYW